MSLFRKQVPIILQAEAAECGLVCVAMIAAFHGRRDNLNALRMSGMSSMRGMNLAHMIKLAETLNFAGRAVRLEIESLKKLRVPCILHWTMDHFVVLERVTARGAHIIDPAIGRRVVSREVLDKCFTGIALELTPTTEFKALDQRTKLKLSAFFRDIQGLGRSLFKLFVISLAIQAIALTIPFFSQLIIDDVLVDRDKNLLKVLGFTFAAISLLQILLSVQRGLFTLTFAAEVQFGWATRVFHHLIRLPLAYFERRSTADILSRFRSVGTIQRLASATIVDTVMDGIMTLLTLVIMLTYEIRLSCISIGALTIYYLIRLAFYAKQREVALSSLGAGAREDSHLLETLRAIGAIKVFGGENLRESVWQNLAAASIQERSTADAIRSLEASANTSLLALENILILTLGASLVMSGSLTVGMLVAFIAYKSQFTGRASGLIDKLMEFRLAEVDLERLSDIALTDRSPTAAQRLDTAPALLNGSVSLKEVSYRYSKNDPWILRNINLSIADGECVAISAPSGTGKTTLLKIMMGLIPPHSGDVTICNLDAVAHEATIRKRISSVMQDDSLLSGTIAENISFFETGASLERIKECATAAAIDQDIARFPMGYNTLVGDSGGALSGGQKQRLLLARALYVQPSILFLDEATAHLDSQVEQRIHQSLTSMKITRIMVAHRAETLAIADRVIHWDDLIAQAGAATNDVASRVTA